MSKAISAEELAAYSILDTMTERDFDDFTKLAALICGVPISLISILDAERQWFKSRLGFELAETPIEQSFCAVAVAEGCLLEVNDARKDPRFSGNPLVLAAKGIRFYAGAPIWSDTGKGIGSLCVIDTQPRTLTESQREALGILAAQLARLLDLRKAGSILRDGQANEKITNERLRQAVNNRVAQLEELETRFKQFAENSEDVFWIFDLQIQKLLYVSPSVARTWGLEASDLYLKPDLIFTRLNGEDAARLRNKAARGAFLETSGIEFEFRLSRPSETEKWMLFRGTILHGKDGVPMRVAGFTKDINYRKIHELKLTLSAQRLRLATKAAKVGIWDLDVATGHVHWDEQMGLLYGTGNNPPQSVSEWESLIHPDDRSTFVHALTSAEPVDQEFRILRADNGETRFIRWSVAVATDLAKGGSMRVGTNLDATEERQREIQLREALSQQTQLTRAAKAGELAKREFLAAMSHEIRTPLNGILGFAENALGLPDIGGDTAEALRIISESGRSLLRILNDVLDFSALEAGEFQVVKEDFSPRELINEIRDFFHPEARNRGLDLEVTVSPVVPTRIRGDAGRIRQVLINLVGNALKFTPEGRISIEIQLTGAEKIDFSVADTGPGIPPEKMEMIFESFSQADFSNSRKHGGTGLGLSISRKLAHLMGGTLKAKNSPAGAVFVLAVPLITAATEVTEKKEGRPIPCDPTGMKVLVAEDDRISRLLLVKVLKSLGYSAIPSQNGVEAVQLFRTEKPDFIFMDLQMPHMDGIEATREIRKVEVEHNWLPAFISALTADVMPENKAACLAAGVDLYLNKPIDKESIAAALRIAEEQRGPSSETGDSASARLQVET